MRIVYITAALLINIIFNREMALACQNCKSTHDTKATKELPEQEISTQRARPNLDSVVVPHHASSQEDLQVASTKRVSSDAQRRSRHGQSAMARERILQ